MINHKIFCKSGPSIMTSAASAQAAHSLGYNKFHDCSRTFQETGNIFPGLRCKPAVLKYRDKQQLLTTYSTIAASIQEYMFITVTCCEETAEKLFKHFSQLATHDVPRINLLQDVFCVCVCALPSKFHDFPGPGT